MNDQDFEKYIRWALDQSMDQAVRIEPSSVVTAPWVRMKCQFGCTGYGQRLCCPPFAPGYEVTRQVLESYEVILLLHSHRTPGDQKGMKKFNESLVDLEFQAFLDGNHKAWSMGCGPCQLCKSCDTTKPCANGKRARPSMEACGIDVYETARKHGLPLKVARTREEPWDMYGLLLLK